MLKATTHEATELNLRGGGEAGNVCCGVYVIHFCLFGLG